MLLIARQSPTRSPPDPTEGEVGATKQSPKLFLNTRSIIDPRSTILDVGGHPRLPCHSRESGNPESVFSLVKESPKLFLNPQSIIDLRSTILDVDTPHKNCYILSGRRKLARSTTIPGPKMSQCHRASPCFVECRNVIQPSQCE